MNCNVVKLSTSSLVNSQLRSCLRASPIQKCYVLLFEDSWIPKFTLQSSLSSALQSSHCCSLHKILSVSVCSLFPGLHLSCPEFTFLNKTLSSATHLPPNTCTNSTLKPLLFPSALKKNCIRHGNKTSE